MKNKTPLFVAVPRSAASRSSRSARNIGNEWPTAQGDAQRTNWLRSDPNISVDTLVETRLRAAVESRTRRPAGHEARRAGRHRQRRHAVYASVHRHAATNDVIAIDNDTGATFWYQVASAPLRRRPAHAPRTGGRNAAVALLESPAPSAARGGGWRRGGRGGYSSSVGSPGEGAPIPAGAGGGGGRGVVSAGCAPADQHAAGAPPAGAPPAAAPPAGDRTRGSAGRRGRRRQARPQERPGRPLVGAAVADSAARQASCTCIARDGMLHVVGLPSSEGHPEAGAVGARGRTGDRSHRRQRHPVHLDDR